MRNPLPDPLKQEESSVQVALGKRREFLSGEKMQESSLLVNISSSLQNNVQVFHLILDKGRASSHVIRKKRTPPQNTDRPFQLHEKQESFVHASVGKKRLFSLGKRLTC